MARTIDQIDNWAGGVVTASVKDRLPAGAVPNAENTQLYNIGDGQAILGTRGGCKPLNTTAIGSPSKIASQHTYDKSTGQLHLLAIGDGTLKKINGSGTVTAIASGVFSAVDAPFSWATANDITFVVNGTDAKKTDGSSVWKFGIAAPVVGAWSAAATSGGSNLPADTYDLAITYYNSTTGQESGRSDTKTVTTTAGQRLQITLPANTTINDAQVDRMRIHIRRQSTQSVMFRVVAGISPAETDSNGWSVTGSTQTIYIDMTSTQFTQQVTQTPGVNDNQPPPSGAKFIAWHRGRMYAATDKYLYWSDVGKPEAFNPLWAEEVNPDAGDPITGIFPVENGLLIFKQSKTFILNGDDPQTWVIDLVHPDLGCASYRSIVAADGITYFWSLYGPRKYSKFAGVDDITTKLIAPSVSSTILNWTKLSQIEGMVNTYEQYVAWSVPEYGSSRNNLILPFNFKLDKWMSTRWDPIDACSATTIKDSDGRPWVMLGDYDGWVYRLGDGTTDGIPASVTVYKGTVSSSNTNTVTVGSAGWPASGLIGRYVYVYKDDIQSYQRRRITANTTDTLTVASQWDANPTSSYTYVLGGPLFEFQTPWVDGGTPFHKKRYEFLWLHVSSPDSNADFEVDIYTNNNEVDAVRHRAVSMATGSTGIWDKSLWDFAIFAMEGSTYERIRVGSNGRNWMARISNLTPGQRVLVLKVAMQGVPETKKLDKGA